jgi:hypothetical protein
VKIEKVYESRTIMNISSVLGSPNILMPSRQFNQANVQRVGKRDEALERRATAQLDPMIHRQVARHQNNAHGDTFSLSRKSTVSPSAKIREDMQVSAPVLDAPASVFASFGNMLGNVFALNN